MSPAPRQILTPRPSMRLSIPEGMTPVEFFNSPANLKNLAEENGLFRTPEDLLMYRKLIGHSSEFDTSIILDTSRRILDPLGRPVRRDQMSRRQKKVWNRMTQILFDYLLETYPDPERHLVLCGEASLDSTWPMNKSGVPSIRMIHNHFMVFPMEQLAQAEAADPDNPNLTDSGHHSLFLRHLSEIYHEFLEVLDLQILRPISSAESCFHLTGYPQGLPSWEVLGGAERLGESTAYKDAARTLEPANMVVVVGHGEDLVRKAVAHDVGDAVTADIRDRCHRLGASGHARNAHGSRGYSAGLTGGPTRPEHIDESE